MRNENNDSPEENRQENWFIKNFLWFWILIILFSIMFQLLDAKKEGIAISYSVLKSQISQSLIKKINLKGNLIKGEYHAPTEVRFGNKSVQLTYFKTTIPEIGDESLIPLIEKHNVELNVQSTEQPLLVAILINLLPWILIFGFFYWLGKRQMKNMGP